MKIVILEFPEQYRAFVKSRLDRRECHLYAMNPGIWDLLDEAAVPHEKLTDEFIREDWKKIIVWARETSLSWFRHPQLEDRLTVDGVNMGNAILSDFRQALTLMATHACFARKIFARWGSEAVYIVFQECPAALRTFVEDAHKPDSISGLLESLARERNLRTEVLRYPGKREAHPPFRFFLKNAGFFCRQFLQPFVRIPKDPVLLWGSQKHLEVFSDAFRDAQRPHFIFSKDFSSSLWKWARDARVPYGVEPPLWGAAFFRFLRTEGLFRGAWSDLCRGIREKRVFCFEGMDLSGMVAKQLEGSFGEIKKRIRAMCADRALFRKKKIKAVLLDEDTSAMKRVLAATAVSESCPVFVVSHGVVGASDFRVDKGVRAASYADCFINSQFEKEKYASWGWDPEKLYITGTPRYDAIYRSRQRPKPVRPEKVILYCPHRLTERKTRSLGWNTPGYVTAQNTRYLIDAISSIPCELWIKPHGISADLELWKAYEGQCPKLRILPPDSDVLQWLRECDLLVATFSSVIIEGLLFDRPVITMNFTGEPDMHPYASFGVTRGVYRPELLSGAITDCLFSEKVRQDLLFAREKHFDYFCGFRDGQNTLRAMQKMTAIMSNASPEAL